MWSAVPEVNWDKRTIRNRINIHHWSLDWILFTQQIMSIHNACENAGSEIHLFFFFFFPPESHFHFLTFIMLINSTETRPPRWPYACLGSFDSVKNVMKHKWWNLWVIFVSCNSYISVSISVKAGKKTSRCSRCCRSVKSFLFDVAVSASTDVRKHHMNQCWKIGWWRADGTMSWLHLCYSIRESRRSWKVSEGVWKS